MRKKTVLIVGAVLLFSACSEKDYKHMYTEQYNVSDLLNGTSQTSAESNVKTMQNGQNPMKRPSYDEYRQQ